MLKIILPIGLSFHTFQAMSYTIEVYRGNFKAERHFGIYALYVMFYPQLVAGPIERPQNVLHQFREKHNFNPVLFQAGLRLMLWGLFKKVVIADRLAIYVDGVFDSPEQLGSLNYILATVFFSVQIYCDFSGYSDIAIGSARTMGFDLMTNFNRPYFSTNIREFWSRWHISLSTWFRDYLYIPLGGNRVSKSRLYYNTVIVFMLSGFWHGAKWTFVVWGGLHAIYSVIHMATKSYFEKMKKRFGWYRLAAVFTTFALVSFAWIFFRANNLHSAGHVISGWFSGGQGFTRVLGPNEIMIMTFIAIMVAFMFFVESRTTPSLTELNTKFNVDLLLSTTVLILIICFGVFNRNSFIYFQF
ncbi:MAG TPA: MBOAT family O-acyltransferase [Flavobacteriales bacterium]|nr:MBOAT family O-acyltransferase [Flavobacteriales bacterium]